MTTPKVDKEDQLLFRSLEMRDWFIQASVKEDRHY